MEKTKDSGAVDRTAIIRDRRYFIEFYSLVAC